MGGLLTGALLYVFGFWLVPMLAPEWLDPFALPPRGRFPQGVAHAVYGLALGLLYARLSRPIAERGARRPHEATP